MRNRNREIEILIRNEEYLASAGEEAIDVLKGLKGYYFPYSLQWEMKERVKRHIEVAEEWRYLMEK
jgi:hypothetical protein